MGFLRVNAPFGIGAAAKAAAIVAAALAVEAVPAGMLF